MIAALIAGVVAIVVILVIVVVVIQNGGGNPTQTSGQAAKAAGQRLGSAPGLVYTGTYGNARATFSVSRDGNARGSYQVAGSPVSRVDIEGGIYLKAPSAYWTRQGEAADKAAKADNRWSKNPSFTLDIKLTDLTPRQLSQTLEQAGNDPLAQRTKVNGVDAIEMRVADTTYFISADKPNRLLRLRGSTGANNYVLDVAPMGTPQTTAFFAALRTDVRDLQDAYDPSINVTTDGLNFGSCSQAGCSVNANVHAPGAGDRQSAQVTMNVKFRGTGSTVSTCKGKGTVPPQGTTRISCRTSGSAWSSWYGSQTGRFTVHAAASFDASVNSATDIQELLTKISQEQAAG